MNNCPIESGEISNNNFGLPEPGVKVYDLINCMNGSRVASAQLNADDKEIYLIRGQGTDLLEPNVDHTLYMNFPISLAVINRNKNAPFEYKLCKNDRNDCPIPWTSDSNEQGVPNFINMLPANAIGQVNVGVRWKDYDGLRAKCCSRDLDGGLCGCYDPVKCYEIENRKKEEYKKNGVSPIPNITCCSKCRDFMRQYCDNETNFFSKPCLDWFRATPTKKTDTKYEYRFKEDLIKKYCEMPQNYNKPECGCYNLQKSLDELKIKNPSLGLMGEKLGQLGVALTCRDPKCNNNTALQPYDLDRDTCPKEIIYCDIKDVTSSVESNSNLSNLTVQNMCGNRTNNINANMSPQVGYIVPGDEGGLSGGGIAGIVIFVLFVLGVVIGGFIYWKFYRN